jgi:pimeloyl-ACP methyl ester carboxylesterase
VAASAHAYPLLLVHGAWHDHRCWTEVSSLLAAKGVDVSCPDLPGHGTNALPLSRVTLKQYVAAIVQLLEAATEPVILVGHSMAGMVVTEAACQVPHKVHSLVYLCAYLPLPGQSVFELIALNRGHEPLTPIELALELSTDKRSCSIDTDQIIPLFYTDAPTGAVPMLQQRFATQASLPLSSAARFEQRTFEALDTVYICCTRDKVIPLHHQRRMLARQSCKTLLQIEADHSPFHSCPHHLAELLGALAQR